MWSSGEQRKTLTSGETLGSTTNVGEQLQILVNIVGQRGNFGNQLQTLAKHCGTKTNIGEELQTLWSSGETLGKLWGNFGETLGATEYWVLGTGYWQTLAGND